MVLTGSGLKGALRAHAERIVRTVLSNPMDAEWSGLKDRERHLNQVDVPLIRHLFGSAKRGKNKVTRPAGRGALTVENCYATAARLCPEGWEALAQAKSDEATSAGGLSSLYKQLDEQRLLADSGNSRRPYFEQAFHVAVDRWTGGAAEGLLFNALEPFNVSWEPIRLTVDLNRLTDRPADKLRNPDPALALLLLLIRDLASERIPLGFGSNRGYGSIAVREISVHCDDPKYEWLNNAVLPSGDIARLESDRLKVLQDELKVLQDEWRTWIDGTAAALREAR